MLSKLKMALLARFIPHRTVVGLVLLVATTAAQTIAGSGLCTAAAGPADICGIADKLIATVAPWLTIMGVADQKRS